MAASRWPIIVTRSSSARDGRVDAVCFTPFNKQAMRLARADYDDEIAFFRRGGRPEDAGQRIQRAGRALERARHLAHSAVRTSPRDLPANAILRALTLTDACMREAGFARPRIAVAGLNPHAGDGGNFGREEIDIIAPAVRRPASARASRSKGRFRPTPCSCAPRAAPSMRC